MPQDKPDLSPQSKANARKFIAQILLAVTLPPIATAIYVFKTGHALPDWLTSALFILIISIETLIMVFTAQLAFLMKEAENIYKEIIKLGDQVKAPLENIGKIFIDMKDLLPFVEKVLSKIDKEQLKKMLEDLAGQIELQKKKLSPEELEVVAKRLSKSK